MAFDLNKNDGSQKEPSKFDLSKREVENPAPRSWAWLIWLLGILVVGGGIWYYSSNKTLDTVAKEPTQNVSSDPAGAATAITPAKEKVDSTDTTTAPIKALGTEEKSNKKDSLNDASPELETAALKALNHTVPVTFVQGSSSFANTNKTLIKRIVAYLIKNPTASIHVDGYASSDGPVTLNQQISQARADAFKNHLTALNIEASRISTTGKGIENPIASNNTNAGRKKNRRVEITLL
ncbi:OmpA family protein [Pedobacter sp. MR2016-19]|uniref:OmpA family protein n=1 Tax=Pedobacter sp. MR2016-19 TaxID=2780089 RepID=UPI001876F3A8|nr:OmpA family protein [Pedobacter sp. MR2016-19]MBE5317725.1 OmpA family protein [Pedobacter sp. MR2016-19]